MNYEPYRELIHKVLRYGRNVPSRQKVVTHALFGYQMRFPIYTELEEPIFTGRRIYPYKALAELEWILAGSPQDLTILHKEKVHWWDSYKPLGKVYGAFFTDQGQFETLEKNLKEEPYSRRHYLTMWDIKRPILPSCIIGFQVLLDDFHNMTLVINQRSADIMLGLPYDILEWYLFGELLSSKFAVAFKELVFNIGSAHIYSDHVNQAKNVYKRPAKEHPIDFYSSRWRKMNFPWTNLRQFFNFSQYKYLDLKTEKLNFHP